MNLRNEMKSGCLRKWKPFLAIPALLGINAVSFGAEPMVGTVVAWGTGELVERLEDRGGYVAITGGREYLIGLRADGTVRAWGRSQYGSVAVPEGVSNIIQIDAGSDHALALRSDGIVLEWPGDQYGPIIYHGNPELGILYKAIASEAGTRLALRQDGTVDAWGKNALGQIDVPPGLTNAVAVAATSPQSLALLDDGTVVAWGRTDAEYSIPADVNQDISSIASGGQHNLVVHSDGTVDAWGNNDYGQINIPSGLGGHARIVGTGLLHSLAVSENEELFVWGRYSNGPAITPQGLSGIVDLAGGYDFSAAIVAAPIIQTQPMGQVVHEDAEVSIHVDFFAQEPFSLQWYHNGEPLADEISNPLIISSISVEHAGDYELEISNEFGTVRSESVSLSVLTNRLDQATEFTGRYWESYGNLGWQSADQNGWRLTQSESFDGEDSASSGITFPGEESRLINEIEGPGLLRFHWKVSSERGFDKLRFLIDGQEYLQISGETDWELQKLHIQDGKHIIEWVYSKDTSGTEGQNRGWVDQVSYYQGEVPLILEQPQDVTAAPGETVVFDVEAEDVGEMEYRWRFNDSNSPDEWETKSLKLTDVQLEDAGDYTVLVSDGGLRNRSDIARLEVLAPPVIATEPQGVNAVLGQSVELVVVASGPGPIFYDWYHNGIWVERNTEGVLEFAALQECDLGEYSVRASNAYGEVESQSVAVLAPQYQRVWSWGQGQSETDDLFLDYPADIIQVSTAFDTNLALTSDGQVIAWGPAAEILSTNQPELGDIVSIKAGIYFAVALEATGGVKVWGHFGSAELQPPAGLTDVVEIAVGESHILALKENGEVVGWGRDPDLLFIPPQGLLAKSIGAGSYHSLAVTPEGGVVSWGWQTDQSSQSYVPAPADLDNVAAVAGGEQHSLALLEDGTVVGWGSNLFGQVDIPEGLTDVVQIAAGDSFSVALKSDGTIVAWGLDEVGLLEPPTDMPKASSIAAGYSVGLAVSRAPIIDFQTCDIVTWTGDSVSLEVSVLGPDPYEYQWSKDGVVLEGATGATLNLSNLQVSDFGVYSVQVSNLYGEVLSNPIRLDNYSNGLTITSQPQSETVASGEDVVFDVGATGQGPFQYRWLKDGDYLENGDQEQFVISDATLDDQGSYQVVITNGNTTVVSQKAILSVQQVPLVEITPADQFAYLGGDVQFSATIEASEPYQIQWFHDGSPLAGENAPTLLLSGLQEDNAGNYSVSVENVAGLTVSELSTLSLVPNQFSEVLGDTGFEWTTGGFSPWMIDSSESPDFYAVSGMIPNGEESWIQTTIQGPGLLRFHWRTSSEVSFDRIRLLQEDWETASIDGETEWISETIQVPPAQITYRWVYSKDESNSEGEDRAWLANVEYQPGPYFEILEAPQSMEVLLGQTARFTAQATGFPFYAWWHNGVELGLPQNENWPNFKILSVQKEDLGEYFLRVIDNFGYIDTEPVLLTSIDPAIMSSPEDVSIGLGENAVFGIELYGRGPLNFQWMQDGADIPGATSSSLVVESAEFCDVGGYSVVAWNEFGIDESDIGFLQLLLPNNLVAWGDNDFGQTDFPLDLANATQIAAGENYAIAILEDGSVAAWGENQFGQLSIKDDLVNPRSVSAGGRHSLAINSSGRVVGWGDNSSGQISIPSRVRSNSSTLAIAAGESHSVAIHVLGDIVAWGNNDFGQLQVPIIATNAVNVVAGTRHSLALLADTSVVGWGDGSSGQTAVPLGLSGVIDIAAGEAHSLALTESGFIFGWGNNDFGQLDVPGELENVVAISAGGNSSAALLNDGSVVIWGEESGGMLLPAADATRVTELALGKNFAVAISSRLRIVGQACGDRLIAGESAIFSVEVDGEGPYEYLWRHDGDIIAGADTNTLSLEYLHLDDAGTYSVEVSNPFESLLTDVFNVEIVEPPLFLEAFQTGTLAWPGWASDYSLEVSSDLINWVPYISEVTEGNRSFSVNIESLDDVSFFRLIKN